MAGTTIKLQTNIQVIGTVDFCDYIISKNVGADGKPYSDQIALRGKWDGAGEGRMYLHLSVEGELQRLGVIGAKTANGNYPILVKEPKVKVTKIEQGTSKKTVIELLGHAGALAQAVQTHTQQQTQGSLYQPAATQAVPATPPNPDATIVDLLVTLKDSIVLATTIVNEQKMTEEFSVAAIGTSLFEQRCRLGLYGKTESVPF